MSPCHNLTTLTGDHRERTQQDLTDGLQGAEHQRRVEGSVGLSPPPFTLDPMTVTLDLPAEAQARLQAEASRRGITLDQLVAEIADNFPAETAAQPGTLEGFFGSGDSGDPGWASRDLHELRHDLAQRRLAEPA